jgi:peptidylprolyl isomerase
MTRSSIAVASLLVWAAAGCNKSLPRPATPAPVEPPPTIEPPAEQTITLEPTPPPKPAVDPNAPADVGAPPPEADRAPSGLASRVLQTGTGARHPGPDDRVKVHYTGWTAAGVKFDSSVDRGEALELPLNGVIKGWTEGLQLMVEGEKRRLWIPGSLAYGDSPPSTPDGPPGMPYGALVFDVELLGIKPAPTVPEDVTAPPRSASRTRSGLAYRVLQKGTGTRHPRADSTVEVHYSGWTTDGKLFDSSVVRGETVKFPLGAVIPGWTEGVQLMVVGERTRFWIPARLAYGDSPRPGVPAGLLVFDVELIDIADASGP